MFGYFNNGEQCGFKQCQSSTVDAPFRWNICLYRARNQVLSGEFAYITSFFLLQIIMYSD